MSSLIRRLEEKLPVWQRLLIGYPIFWSLFRFHLSRTPWAAIASSYLEFYSSFLPRSCTFVFPRQKANQVKTLKSFIKMKAPSPWFTPIKRFINYNQKKTHKLNHFFLFILKSIFVHFISYSFSFHFGIKFI